MTRPVGAGPFPALANSEVYIHALNSRASRRIHARPEKEQSPADIANSYNADGAVVDPGAVEAITAWLAVWR